MYTAAHIKSFQQQTESWLKTQPAITEENVEPLRDLLRFHEHRYYVENDPLISDYEYDQLYKMLEKAEQDNPAFLTSDSPTQRVGNSLNGNFTTVQHLVPMLSLENSYNSGDLLDWDRKCRELTKLDEIEYCVEPKFDGASISLIYEDNKLTRSATRGDGVQGDDITTNSKQIRSIPLSAPFNTYGFQQLEVRGEVLMSKKSFKAYNDMLAEQNLPPLANPRNAASGSLRIKDPKEVGRRNLEAFIYHVAYTTGAPEPKAGAKQPGTHSEMLEMLWQCGFRSPKKEMKVFKGMQGVIDHCNAFEQNRDNLPYEIDGMVIKVNDLELQDKMGMTTHHPRWAMAYKFKARQGTSKLKAVEYQVGRTGNITPVAKIDPVFIGGVTVGSISLFNEDVIREKDLMIGDTVLVERAGDVIPYIVKPLAELRDGTQQPIAFIKECPVCKSKLVREESEAAWRCINIECPAQVAERMIHYVSKDAMDIRSFGSQQVKKFYELGFLKDIPGIYTLDFETIGKLEGFGKKSIENLQAAIETSKQQPLHRLIYGLGIRHVGETMAKALSQQVKHIYDLKNYTEEQLMELEDVGPKVAQSIVQFFSNEQNLHMLKQLEELGVNMQRTEKQHTVEGGLEGQTFLFTGTLSQFKRSDAEELVEAKGGKILGGVSSKLNYLVVGEDAGSKLEKAKKIPGIKILTEAEFDMLIKTV